jgi:hypothetical protein
MNELDYIWGLNLGRRWLTWNENIMCEVEA